MKNSLIRFNLLCLLAVTSCRSSRPVPGPLLLANPQPTIYPHVFLLTKNEGEMVLVYKPYKTWIDERKRWTEQGSGEQLEKLQYEPVGGILIMEWTRPKAKLVNPSNFTVMVYSPSGRERERFIPSGFPVPERSKEYTYGLRMPYNQSITKYLTKRARDGSRVEIVDHTTGQHFWFLLRFP